MAKGRKKKRGRKGIGTLLVVLLLVAAIFCCYILWKKGYLDVDLKDSSSIDSSLADGSSWDSSSWDSSSSDIVTDELSIHFLMLGNKYSGDCTLIKAGDTEILIDAGSRQSSASTIVEYVNNYCTDGILEYVIATHADQDHIAGFVGNKNGGDYTGILYEYQVGTLIEFARTDKSLTTAAGNPTLYANYRTAVAYAESKGTAAYTALECWNGTNGAQRSYEISEGITMNILYNVFYEEKSSDENNYSVCMLLTQGNNHYLFTGDLEEKGEEALVENNTLPKCKLFKAGHHGSPTSSTEALLSVIQPEIVCVSCCCGSEEYTKNPLNVFFPSQAFVDRVSVYTDKIYVTTIVSDKAEGGFEPMNGNIVVSSNGGDVKVNCSDNNTLFKDTDWFKKNRTLPENAVGAA